MSIGEVIEVQRILAALGCARHPGGQARSGRSGRSTHASRCAASGAIDRAARMTEDGGVLSIDQPVGAERESLADAPGSRHP
jgi:hypothetical protein